MINIDLEDLALIGALSLSWIPIYYSVARPSDRFSKKLKDSYDRKFNEKYFQKTEPLI